MSWLLGNGANFQSGETMPLKPNCPVIAIEEHYWDCLLYTSDAADE